MKYMYHSFSTSFHGHLDCFRVFIIIDFGAVDTTIHVIFLYVDFTLFRHISRSCTVGSYSSSVLRSRNGKPREKAESQALFDSSESYENSSNNVDSWDSSSKSVRPERRAIYQSLNAL